MCACYSSQDFPMSACVRALCGCPRLIVTKIVEPNCGAVCVALRRSLGGEACHRAPFVVIRCVSSPIAVHGTPHTHCNMYGTLCLFFFFFVLFMYTVCAVPHTHGPLCYAFCWPALLVAIFFDFLLNRNDSRQRRQAAQLRWAADRWGLGREHLAAIVSSALLLLLRDEYACVCVCVCVVSFGRCETSVFLV